MYVGRLPRRSISKCRSQPLKYRRLGPITQAFELNFDPRVNVLIGPNAVGKSTIIRELARQHEQPPLMDDYDSFEDGVEFGDGDFLPLISVPSSRLVFPMTGSDVVEEYSFKQTLDAGYNILDSRQVFRTFQNFSDYIWPIVAEAWNILRSRRILRKVGRGSKTSYFGNSGQLCIANL